MKRGLIIALVLLCIAGTAMAQSDLARTITVRGVASTYVMPDNVAWSLTISVKDDNLAKLRSRADAILSQVKEAVSLLEVDTEDFILGGVRINMWYKYEDRRETDEFSHYSLSQDITVIQDSINSYDTYWHHLTGIDGIKVRQTFYVSDLESTKSEVQINAFHAAKQKAIDLAGVAGDSVGKALTISEFKPIDHASDALRVSNVKGTPWFSPQQVEVSASVYVVFELL